MYTRHTLDNLQCGLKTQIFAMNRGVQASVVQVQGNNVPVGGEPEGTALTHAATTPRMGLCFLTAPQVTFGSSESQDI